jgi:hypothetical protein
MATANIGLQRTSACGLAAEAGSLGVRRLATSLIAAVIGLSGCAHAGAPRPSPLVADPKPLDAQLYGERLDALLIDVVREANFVGRTRVTIQYDRGWKSGYVIVTDQGVGRHWEKPLSPAAIQRLVQIIDDRSLMAAGSSSRGACMDGTSWAVVIRLNWRVHEFFWDSCSSEEPSQALKEFFVAGGAE